MNIHWYAIHAVHAYTSIHTRYAIHKCTYRYVYLDKYTQIHFVFLNTYT